MIMACHNRAELTAAALAALEEAARTAGVSLDLCVADDGSRDATPQVLARQPFPVRVARGPGDWYWARSMAAAERLLVDGRADYLLWLNDDVLLDPDALSRLLPLAAGNRIVAGGVRGRDSQLTYGGYHLERSSFHFRLSPAAAPVDAATRVDAANGNVLLVPQHVAARVGPIDGAFAHGYADLDYTLRARALGIYCLLAPGTVGRCESNPGAAAHIDPEVALRHRLRAAWSPKGIPPRSQARFLRRHAGRLWPIVLAGSYLGVLVPRRVRAVPQSRARRARWKR